VKNILLIGGAGYVGTELAKLLIKKNYYVTVFDLFIYGEKNLKKINSLYLKLISGDIRDLKKLKTIIPGHDLVIHLACISNDPSFDLDPQLGKSINFDPFEELVKISKNEGVKRFIYASSSSVYGIKNDPNVDENCSLKPLTDYSKYKAMCEEILFKFKSVDFVCTSIRPATVCGYSERQRLDLVVNILTNHAVNKNKITVFGGSQQRPNLHIKDMCRSYIHVLEEPIAKISGKIFNVGAENLSLDEIAIKVQQITKMSGSIEHQETNDLRSYRVDSSLIYQQLGFAPNYSIDDAIIEIVDAFRNNQYLDPLNNSNYYNIKKMKELNLG
jgi:nucleoside-diphosphate-sugar epimerase